MSVWILEMLEDRLTHHGIEGVIAKRQPSARADKISSLILNGVEIHHLGTQQFLRRVSCAEVETNPL